MKTNTIMLAALFTLQSAILFAGNETAANTPSTELSSVEITALAPVTPTVATFEEFAPVAVDVLLAPVTPAVADFSDTAPDPFTVPSLLIPATPAEADFSEAMVLTVDPAQLAPSVPAEADFE